MTQELEKKETSLTTPDYLKKYQGDGADDISSSLIEKSFLQMAHDSDKEGVSLGDWYDSATGESFGPSVVVTVCKISQNWRKFDSDFKLVTQSQDGVTWDNGDSLSEDDKWKCAFLDFFVILNDNPSGLPFIISFKGTSFRTGKKFTTSIAKFTKGNGEPMYARNYTLYTEEAKKGSKTYSVARYKLNSGFNSEDIVVSASKVRGMVMNIVPTITEDNPEPQDDKEYNFEDAELD